MSKSGYKMAGLAIDAAITVALLFGCADIDAQSAAKAAAITLPPMGWSSWNSFSNTVDSDVIVSQAKAMIASGMHKAGYEYINIDEGWWLGKRDAQGNIVVDPNDWPALAPGEHAGDMSNIVRYIHKLGLKAGIYTDAGRDGCGTFSPDIGPGYPGEGSEGHYEQDFLQFAKWGFDYVKVDWCGGNKENLDPAIQYGEIARAIGRAEAITGHRLFYSICNWGKQSPWTWAPNVGGAPADIWRTSGDIVAPVVAGSKNAGRKASFKKMLSNFDQGIHPEAQHTGFYNDPDMMVIGMPGLNDAENRAHMSLWAISGAPLLVGADLATLSDATLATLTNPAVIAIDQDALGLQAVKVREEAGGLEIWSKKLSKPGERAVLVLNRSDAEASIVVSPITVYWKDLGLAGSAATVRDPWTGKDLGTFDQHYRASVQRGDAVLLVVRGAEAKSTRILPEGATNSTKEKTAALKNEEAFRFKALPCDQPVAAIQVNYSNPGAALRFAELRANGQTPTRIAFPATGSAVGTVWIQVFVDREQAGTSGNNVLKFSSVAGAGPQIDSISLNQNGLCPGGAASAP
ncbi:MAG TPA: alpha-galactosidase [Terracidiphilus sp.]|nr:alpha-galactosidase [Terracidiphilus sp.]